MHRRRRRWAAAFPALLLATWWLWTRDGGVYYVSPLPAFVAAAAAGMGAMVAALWQRFMGNGR